MKENDREISFDRILEIGENISQLERLPTEQDSSLDWLEGGSIIKKTSYKGFVRDLTIIVSYQKREELRPPGIGSYTIKYYVIKVYGENDKKEERYRYVWEKNQSIFANPRVSGDGRVKDFYNHVRLEYWKDRFKILKKKKP